ncbi:CU044_5270 family protein [Actinomadura rudentiformis]|uniref:CU044_5270 family protein n=1 Tax=Actinomadura rudentiformis TaxID=359158 RepID=A0A6H9YJG6_9ACTN|nr:CU044_5270 family protein [Actinomadura rudentiformis]KAB2339086.1 hypothetical protein F8566_49025 [Actinomadura rudentiformis]
MNDLQILHDSWDNTPPPNPDVRAAARAALLERAAATSMQQVPADTAPATAFDVGGRRRVTRARIGAVVTGVLVAAAVAGGVATVQVRDDGGPPGVTGTRPMLVSAAFVLDRAAGAAERRAWTPPRPDQWIYTHFRNVPVKQRWPLGGENGPGESQMIEEQWQRADGRRSAFLDGGKLHFVDETRAPHEIWPPSDYAGLARLPADPDALLALAYRHVGPLGDKPSTAPPGIKECIPRIDREEVAFTSLLEILGTNLLPPKLEAAVYRAMKKVPGVVVDDADGMIALGRHEDGWQLNEVLFDARTYRYTGQRSTAVKDPAEVLKEGCGIRSSGLNMRIVSVGVVNAAGQRP